MSLVYLPAVDAFLSGDVDITAVTVKAQLLGAAYVVDPAHSSESDLDGLIGSAETVTVDHVADGAVYVDPIVFPAVAAGSTVTAMVVYVDGGVLLSYVNRSADKVLLAIDTDDEDITMAPTPLLKL